MLALLNVLHSELEIFFFYRTTAVIFDNLRFDKKSYIYIYAIDILFEYICIVYKNGEDLNRPYNLRYKI